MNQREADEYDDIDWQQSARRDRKVSGWRDFGLTLAFWAGTLGAVILLGWLLNIKDEKIGQIGAYAVMILAIPEYLATVWINDKRRPPLE